MRRFVFDEDAEGFVEVPRDPEVEEIKSHICPAPPESQRPMTEAEALARIERMRNDPSLPMFYTWPRTHRVQ